MDNYKELINNNNNNNNNKDKSYKKYIPMVISMIPVVSSALCAIYVVLMYKDVKILLKNFDTINNLITVINTTKIETLIDGLLSLEKCVLTKLPICS